MSGFKMTIRGGGVRGRSRSGGDAGTQRAVSAALSLFRDDEEESIFSSRGVAKKRQRTADIAGGANSPAELLEVDPLDAFMAGIDAEVAAKPAGDETDFAMKARAGWEELQEEDPVVSYCEEVYDRKASKGKGSGTETNPGCALGDHDDSDPDQAGPAGGGGSDDEDHDRRTKPSSLLPSVDHAQVAYEPVRFDFYVPHADIERLTPEQVAALRKDLRITATGSGCPNPVVSFAHLGLHEGLMEGIRKHGYVRPTPIQAQAIPAGLSGRHVVGVAETGSGKTMAFLMPMLVHCADQPVLQRDEGPIGLVLCPTRELAMQIETETFKFNRPLGLRSVTLAGGLSKHDQFKAIKRGSEIVIATPGRIIDIMQMKGCSLQRCTFVVLDEADRMLYMGFESQVRSVVQNVRPVRQTLLFSATLPPKIERLANDLLERPVRITVGELGQAAANIVQVVEVLSNDEEKWVWLSERVLGMVARGQLLVFTKSRQGTEELAKRLSDCLCTAGGAAALHGDMNQDERNRTLQAFREGKVGVLVATDIAARGLDVPSIRTVVSYDVARDIETHTHRVGRTGRAGLEGDAFTLLAVDGQQSRKIAVQLVEHLRQVGSLVSVELLTLAKKHPAFRNDRPSPLLQGAASAPDVLDPGPAPLAPARSAPV